MTIEYRLMVCKQDNEGAFAFWIERKKLWLWHTIGGDSIFSCANLMMPEYPMYLWHIPVSIKKVLLIDEIQSYVRELDALDILQIGSAYLLCNFSAEVIDKKPYFFGNANGLIQTIV